MPLFRFDLRHQRGIEVDEIGVECGDAHAAYLQAYAAIPDVARDLLIEGRDPMVCAYLVYDKHGRRLMEVPFTEVLSAAEWKARRPCRRPHGGPRSARAREELALKTFRRMFGSAAVACALLTPELYVTEITEFGARHGNVDPEAVRGRFILDIFPGLKEKPKQDFYKFNMLAQTGRVSEIVDLPYYVLNERGETADGWWNARAWPIFDDDDRMLGFVEQGVPFTRPTAGGRTVVRIAPGSSL